MLAANQKTATQGDTTAVSDPKGTTELISPFGNSLHTTQIEFGYFSHLYILFL